jgi:hypothetical protein
MSRQFVVQLERYACKHGVEVVRFRPGERKDDVMAERLKRFEGAEGVVFIEGAGEDGSVPDREAALAERCRTAL